MVVRGHRAGRLFVFGRSISRPSWLARELRPLYRLSYGKFFIDQIYQVFIVWPLRVLAAISYWVDRYVIDRLVNFVGALPGFFGAMLRSLQNGMVQFYAPGHDARSVGADRRTCVMELSV